MYEGKLELLRWGRFDLTLFFFQPIEGHMKATSWGGWTKISMPTWQDIWILENDGVPQELVEGSSPTSATKFFQPVPRVAPWEADGDFPASLLALIWCPQVDSQERSRARQEKLKLISLASRRRKEGRKGGRSRVGHDDYCTGGAFSFPGLASAAPDALLQLQEGNCSSSVNSCFPFFVDILTH